VERHHILKMLTPFKHVMINWRTAPDSKSNHTTSVHAAGTAPGAVATGRVAELAFRCGARSLPLPVPYQCRLVRFRRDLEWRGFSRNLLVQKQSSKVE